MASVNPFECPDNWKARQERDVKRIEAERLAASEAVSSDGTKPSLWSELVSNQYPFSLAELEAENSRNRRSRGRKLTRSEVSAALAKDATSKDVLRFGAMLGGLLSMGFAGFVVLCFAVFV